MSQRIDAVVSVARGTKGEFGTWHATGQLRLADVLAFTGSVGARAGMALMAQGS